MIGLLVYVLKNIIDIFFLIGDGIGCGFVNVNYFVFEVDEYECYFMLYYLEYLIIINIDFDYFDYFIGLEDVFNVFNDYVK